MFLMARKIKAMGIKMVLSGEGADEIFGGYLYFHKAPDAKAFHKETVDKLKVYAAPLAEKCKHADPHGNIADVDVAFVRLLTSE